MQSKGGTDSGDTQPRFPCIRFHVGFMVGTAIIVTGISIAFLPVPLWHALALGVGFALFRAAGLWLLQSFTTSFWDRVKARSAQLGPPVLLGAALAITDCALMAIVLATALLALRLVEFGWDDLAAVIHAVTLMFGTFGVYYLQGGLILIVAGPKRALK